MASDGEHEESAGRVARDAAVSQAASFAVYLLMSVAITVAITNRDTITPLWMRVKHVYWSEPRRDRHAREVAEFRRDVNDISRGGRGPDTARTAGIYER